MTDPIGTDALLDRIEDLEAENAKLRKGLELYQRERDGDVLVKALFELLDTVEETDDGKKFRPTVIRSCRSDHVEKLDHIMSQLKSTIDL